ncbi:unnamed protein product [Closterium sp. NIES-64]|nr:unnamed protein product [Closterium sp. NIES-64]
MAAASLIDEIADELQALEAVYGDVVRVQAENAETSTAGQNKAAAAAAAAAAGGGMVVVRISVELKPQTGEDATQQFVEATAVLLVTPQYPLAPAVLRLSAVKGMSDERVAELLARARAWLAEALGPGEPMLLAACEVQYKDSACWVGEGRRGGRGRERAGGGERGRERTGERDSAGEGGRGRGRVGLGEWEEARGVEWGKRGVGPGGREVGEGGVNEEGCMAHEGMQVKELLTEMNEPSGCCCFCLDPMTSTAAPAAASDHLHDASSRAGFPPLFKLGSRPSLDSTAPAAEVTEVLCGEDQVERRKQFEAVWQRQQQRGGIIEPRSVLESNRTNHGDQHAVPQHAHARPQSSQPASHHFPNSQPVDASAAVASSSSPPPPPPSSSSTPGAAAADAAAAPAVDSLRPGSGSAASAPAEPCSGGLVLFPALRLDPSPPDSFSRNLPGAVSAPHNEPGVGMGSEGEEGGGGEKDGEVGEEGVEEGCMVGAEGKGEGCGKEELKVVERKGESRTGGDSKRMVGDRGKEAVTLKRTVERLGKEVVGGDMVAGEARVGGDGETRGGMEEAAAGGW